MNCHLLASPPPPLIRLMQWNCTVCAIFFQGWSQRQIKPARNVHIKNDTPQGNKEKVGIQAGGRFTMTSCSNQRQALCPGPPKRQGIWKLQRIVKGYAYQWFIPILSRKYEEVNTERMEREEGGSRGGCNMSWPIRKPEIILLIRGKNDRTHFSFLDQKENPFQSAIQSL